jgi:hypothetical protein
VAEGGNVAMLVSNDYAEVIIFLHKRYQAVNAKSTPSSWP